jgi:hypothetical protein
MSVTPHADVGDMFEVFPARNGRAACFESRHNFLPAPDYMNDNDTLLQ